MMKLHFGRIPENPDFNPETQGWIAITEPSPWLAQLLALPVAGLTFVLLGIIWLWLTPLAKVDLTINLAVVVGIVAIGLSHELIHALCHPASGASSKSILGFWPSKLVFYAHYDGALSKQRFIGILAGPFIVLSLVPLLYCAVFQYTSSALFGISLFNGLVGSADLLGVVLILWQVPSGAITRNKGWRTYYRMAEQDASADPSSS